MRNRVGYLFRRGERGSAWNPSSRSIRIAKGVATLPPEPHNPPAACGRLKGSIKTMGGYAVSSALAYSGRAPDKQMLPFPHGKRSTVSFPVG